MTPTISSLRFTKPSQSIRPKGAPRFELWAPKLGRRVTLFDQSHVKFCAYLESNPRISAYCERPTYWQVGEERYLIDFWFRTNHREIGIIIGPKAKPGTAGVLASPLEKVIVRYVQPKSLMLRDVWIDNWMRILPYLSSNSRFVSDRLLNDIEQAAKTVQTIGEIERDFQPNDVVLVRTAIFMLIHRGKLSAYELRFHDLGPRLHLTRVTS